MAEFWDNSVVKVARYVVVSGDEDVKGCRCEEVTVQIGPHVSSSRFQVSRLHLFISGPVALTLSGGILSHLLANLPRLSAQKPRKFSSGLILSHFSNIVSV